MKKLLTIMMCVSFIALSCKKDKNNTPNQNQTELKKEELIPYYIAVEHKLSGNKIGLIYFAKVGDNVKATFQGDGYTQTGDITVKDQGFSFDANSDGNYIYSFSFSKNADGKFVMKSYQFTDKTSVSQGLNYAVIARKEDVPAFEGVNFKTKEGIYFTLKKDANNVPNINWDIKKRVSYNYVFIPPTTYLPIPNDYVGPEYSKPYTKINGLGWKENGGLFFGISVPEWKDSTTPLMLLESGNTLYLAAITKNLPCLLCDDDDE
ncbi:hypothetical protein [Pedobacter ureilyticus]|uniref:DUF4369 domain-containing protein n=1 Tax=Pedobacter ureilyticus TaxID=1393051 RepID=A0ABW9J1S9_9SPHI|nr:hypothetical protein [Pedobacter helvus]